MLHGIALKTLEPAARRGQCLAYFTEDRTVARDHLQRPQRLDPVQGRRHVAERGFAHEFRKGNAEAVFPQGIRRDQRP
ncbi:hypothetical protein D9M68_966620 [compost metagenome]